MSYLDVEKQLNTITDNLKQNLKDANAIDDSGNVVNVAEFNRIIDSAIDKCRNILQQLEIERKYDPNSTNITFSRINWLETIKSAQSFNAYTNQGDGKEERTIEEINEHKETLLSKIFGAIKNIGTKKNPPMPQNQHSK